MVSDDPQTNWSGRNLSFEDRHASGTGDHSRSFKKGGAHGNKVLQIDSQPESEPAREKRRHKKRRA